MGDAVASRCPLERPVVEDYDFLILCESNIKLDHVYPRGTGGKCK
jgi:hypothetical protein